MSGQGTLPTSGGYAGPMGLQTPANPFNAISFLVQQVIAGKAFSALVQVKSVIPGGHAGATTVSVQPMVNQIDGLGNQVQHGTIYNLPCFRLQGGANAVVLDPVVGDIGQAIICDRDISTVKVTRAVAGPGSWRQNSWADGCYFGGFLNVAPTQYVEFTGGGVNVVSTGTISLSAPGNITITSSAGLITVAGPLGVSVAGKDFLTHEHTGVTAGISNTGTVV
jgi:hypothetical protein